jgi:hypothetical protein
MRIHRQPIWPADQSLDAKENQSDPHNGNSQEDGFSRGWMARNPRHF